MVELNEKTRLDLRFSNVWAILVSVAMAIATFLAIYYGVVRRLDGIETQLTYLVKQQDEYFERNHAIHERVGLLEIFEVRVTDKLGL